ncbi:MAG TPA: peptidoglycan editing factor PgeF [Candidatus Cloacimonadota bacterium]|nr:peptidoglycan editing factor PgeF [Candidatus Cloacimonadota bacterium]
MKNYFYLGKREPEYRELLSQSCIRIEDKVIPLSQVVSAEQVHGNQIHICTEADSGAGFGDKAKVAGVDGLITAAKEQYLMIRTADCAPVLMMDKQHRAVAALHSGRDGTRLNIVGKAIDMLKEHFGILPQDLCVWIGACICAQHYQVSAELYEEFVIAMQEQKLYPRLNQGNQIDIRLAVFQQLLRAGVAFRDIDQDMNCTYQDRSYHSYRRDGSKLRQINIVGIEHE